jgi:PAS domain S-box-containing protein
MTAPIIAADGRLIAVLAGTIDVTAPRSVFQILATTKIGTTGYLFLFGLDRTILAHPDQARILKKAGQHGENVLFDQAVNGFEGSAEITNVYGKASVASFKRLKSTGIIVASVLPSAEAFQAFSVFRNVYLPGMMIILFAAFLGIWWLTKSTTSNLEYLTHNIEQIDPHHLAGTEQIQITSGDEIERLATAFNSLFAEVVAAHQQVFQSEARLRCITDSTPNAIIMMDSNGTITFWNPAAQMIFGYSAEEATGKNLHDLLAPARYHQAFYAAFPAFVRTGKGAAIGTSTELAARTKDNREISVAVSLSAVMIDGAWVAVGIVRDITDVKHYQEQLIEARQTAEAANRAKSQFLANMSHEIRTPMNGILGMTQLLRYTMPSKEQEEYLTSLELSGNNLLALINDILDISKIEADRLILEESEFSVSSCIKEVVFTQLPQVKQKKLQIETVLSDDLPVLMQGDPLRFKQVVLNLLGNAIKFTKAGTITVKASLRSEQGSAHELLVEVHDTGIGITPEAIERIFSSFEQADNSTTRTYGGTGLGLAICRRLAELMGGRIRVESIPEQGSSFYLELPCNPTAKTALKPVDQQPQAAVAVQQMKGLRVLVAEDNDLNAKTIVAMLTRLGHEATVASHGQEALELWNNTAFNCILMDISMPVMDGCLAMSTIRQQEVQMGGHAPIIAMTAHALSGDRERFLAEGFDGYLAKPVIMELLTEELDAVLHRRDPDNH